jgi:diguanylate cyclase (GGDEF)-like protein
MPIIIVDSDENESRDQEILLKKAGYSSIISVKSMPEALKILGSDTRISPAPSGPSNGVDLVIVSSDTIDLAPGGSNDTRDSFQWSIDELNCFLEECADISRRVKSTVNYQDIPVIVVTTVLNSGTLPFVIAYGAYDFIRKPYSQIEYLARVRSAIKLKHEMNERKLREKELLEATKQLAELNTMLARLSLIDSMTGVPNRRSFDRILAKEWGKAIQVSSPITVLMIDVDYFKDYNDYYGHQKGDECLRIISKILKENLQRPNDGIFRYGGEEFVIVLPNTSARDAELVGEALRAAIFSAGLPHERSKTSSCVTVSIGAGTMVPGSQSDSSELVELADQALYVAKNSGRNKVVSVAVPKGTSAA